MRRLVPVAPVAAVLLCCIGCSDVVYHQTRQPPSRGGISPWLRTEDPQSYQTPWRSPALATNEDNQPAVRMPCEPPGPGFPATSLVGVSEPLKPSVETLPTTRIAKLAVFAEPDHSLPLESSPIAGVQRADSIAVTREPRGAPPIGGYDRRPAPYVGQIRGVEATKISGMRLKQDDWCLDEER